MTPATIQRLLLAAVILLLTSSEGKKVLPSILGINYVQWGLAVISSLILPVGIFYSIRAIFIYPEQRRQSGFACLLFSAIFSLMLICYGVGSPLKMGLSHTLDDLSSEHLLPELLHGLQSSDSPEIHLKMAKSIFVCSGIQIPYRLENGAYTVYQPTKQDQDLWNGTKATNEEIATIKEQQNWEVKQMQYLMGLYAVSFFIVFLIGSLHLMYQRKSA